MSRGIKVQFEVRDMLIMKDALKELGYDFIEQNPELLIIKKGYQDIQIDAKQSSITYDNSDTKTVNKIKQTYTLNFYKDRAIKEGNQLREEVRENGEIVLRILR